MKHAPLDTLQKPPQPR